VAKAGGRRGSKKQVKEPMSRKEWYDVIAPTTFKTRAFTKTICNKTTGLKIAADNIRGRVFEANLADLDNGTNIRDQPYRKIKLVAQDVQGRNVLTQFHGLSLTTDKLRSMFRKWCTTIEAIIDAKTADGYTLRLFVIAFTNRQANQLSKNCYCADRLERWVRHRMTKLTQKRLAKYDINRTVTELTHDTLTDTLYKRCNAIVPLRDVKLTKVKLLRAPRFDPQKLADAHGELPVSTEDQARIVVAAPEAVVEAASA